MLERGNEKYIRLGLQGFASISILVSLGITVSLIYGAFPFFKEYSIFSFLIGKDWNANAETFGVLPLFIGTMQIILFSAFIALPLGLASAIYISEYATSKARAFLKPILELLAGIPSIVYGFFAYNMINPLVADGPYSALGASIAVGIMITPLVASLSEDALRAVPRAMKEAAYGLGSTKFETITKILIPAALSGIMSSFVLAISRALGETMIVALAAGGVASMHFNPFEPTFTITGAIVASSGTDAAHNSLEYTSLYGLGMLLFIITLVFNIFAKYITNKFRIKYE